jgi:hypothetical protein
MTKNTPLAANEVRIVCPSDVIAQAFMSWLDGQGEQSWDMWIGDQPGTNGGSVELAVPEYDYEKKVVTIKSLEEK